jgi:hypothetical protein
MLLLALAGAGLAGVIVYDLLQRKHAILRNVPIVGHFGYLLESVGPELRQYIERAGVDETAEIAETAELQAVFSSTYGSFVFFVLPSWLRDERAADRSVTRADVLCVLCDLCGECRDTPSARRAVDGRDIRAATGVEAAV